MADIWKKMKCSEIVSLLVVLFCPYTATSQWNVPWGKVDTMYAFPWNATGFPTGVYFARLTAGPFMACRKLLLLR